jgi:hypothetical protein
VFRLKLTLLTAHLHLFLFLRRKSFGRHGGFNRLHKLCIFQPSRNALLGASRQVFLDCAVSRHPQNNLVAGFEFRFLGHQISPPIRL